MKHYFLDSVSLGSAHYDKGSLIGGPGGMGHPIEVAYVFGPEYHESERFKIEVSLEFNDGHFEMNHVYVCCYWGCMEFSNQEKIIGILSRKSYSDKESIEIMRDMARLTIDYLIEHHTVDNRFCCIYRNDDDYERYEDKFGEYYPLRASHELSNTLTNSET